MEESDAFLAALFFHVWLKFSCWLIDPPIRALLSLFPARFAPVLASMGRKETEPHRLLRRPPPSADFSAARRSSRIQ